MDAEKQLNLSEAVDLLKCSRNTLKRWIRVGFPQRGTRKLIKLEATFWLNHLYVTESAIARFKAAIQAPVVSFETPDQERRRHEATERDLVKRGLKKPRAEKLGAAG